MRKLALNFGIVLAIFVVAFFATTNTAPAVGTVSRIEVKVGYGSDKATHVIEDPARVQQIVQFIDGERNFWGGLRDFAGVPVPQVKVLLYDGERFRGHFGVGTNFFVRQLGGGFGSKHASTADRDQFLMLIGLPSFESLKPPWPAATPLIPSP